MDETLAARLERLESAVAHLEHLTEQLNAIVVQHEKRLERLANEWTRLGDTVAQIELERARNTSTKPPHYQ